MKPGRKIIVLGCSGSGKSTFSRRLREITDLPLIHLDNIWWKPDRTHISREEFDRKLEEILRTDGWILDGDYSRTYEMRFRACDTIIFLDYDEQTCLKGIAGRTGQVRSDIPWAEDKPDPELVRLVRNYRGDNRPRIYELMKLHPEKRGFAFETRAQADEWLSEI